MVWTMSPPTLSLRVALACLSLSTACGDDTHAADDHDDSSSTGASPTDDTSSAATSDGDTTDSTSDASSEGEASSTSGSETGAPTASWMIDSNIIVNEQDIQDAVMSVAAVQDGEGDSVFTEVVLTNVPAYCDALTAGDCGPQGETFTFRVLLLGTEPGTYDIADGTASAGFGDLTETCLSGGFGASSGTITFTTVDTAPGGIVEVDFDVQFDFLGAYATGTAIAPICDPTP